MLPMITAKQNALIEHIITQFLWKGKRPKIPLDILYRDKKDGGLRINNVKMRQKALRITWIHKILNRSDWEYAYQWLIPEIKELIWRCNIHEKDIVKLMDKKKTFGWKPW